MLPANFFVGVDLGLRWRHRGPQATPWELFHGRLLDPSHSRKSRCLEMWQVCPEACGDKEEGPILSVLFEAGSCQIHVVRGFRCLVWEGYHAGANVYLSRRVDKWVYELSGTIDATRFTDLTKLADELICRLFLAVVGSSRLPLISTEAPLPEFTLGQLTYCPRSAEVGGPADAMPLRSTSQLVVEEIGAGLAKLEKVKLLEILVRSTPPNALAAAGADFVRGCRQSAEGIGLAEVLLRALFNEAALTPYTDFVPKAVDFIAHVFDGGGLTMEGHADCLGFIIRQLCRHLTAYDLVTFHHRGANYPDLLLLNELLKAYLLLLEGQPASFKAAHPERQTQAKRRQRLRRRALRQGWLIRRRYEGLPVPDAPTSPGENARLLPPAYPPVPEEQISDPSQRKRHLFDGDDLTARLSTQGWDLLQQSFNDLQYGEELCELGTALFLDRPLGGLKNPMEPDQTPLFSYVAFSRSLARQRLDHVQWDLGRFQDKDRRNSLQQRLTAMEVPGVCGPGLEAVGRPGAVSLADAHRVADDFVFVEMTPRARRDFLQLYDFRPLARSLSLDWLEPEQRFLLMRSREPAEGKQAFWDLYDAHFSRRIWLRFELGQGYVSRGGFEYPEGGLRILQSWDHHGNPQTVGPADAVIRIRADD
jgi:hypothetical protein